MVSRMMFFLLSFNLSVSFNLCSNDIYAFDQVDLIEKIDSLNNKATLLIYSDSVNASSIAKEALVLAEKLNYKEGLAKASRHLGLLSLLKGDLQRAKRYYESNLSICLNLNNDSEKTKAYLLITEVTKREGNSVVTLDYLLKALSIIETSNDLATFSRVLDGLGSHFRQAGDLSLAEKYYRKSLLIRNDSRDTTGLVYSYQVLGNLYSIQDKENEAKKNYLNALALSGFISNKGTLSTLLSNLGSIYLLEKDLDSAYYYYNEAFEIQKGLGNQYSQALLLNNLTALTHEQSKFLESNNYALEGISLAKEVNAPKILSSLYYNLSDNYKALKDFEKSFYYYKLSDSIDYELTNKEKNAQLAELQVQYETEKKDKEIALQNIALVKGSAQRNLLIAGISGLIIISLIIYRALARKKRSNRLLTEQKYLVEKREKEKALLLRELHHRVKNNFQIVSSLLNLQYYDTEDLKAAQAIKSGQARVEAMSMIHRELYQSENITSIEMGDYVKHMIENTAYSFQYESDQIDVLVDVDSKSLSVRYAIPLGIIVNELVTNSFKHAFQSVNRPMLSVSIKINEEKGTVSIVVFDNGPGIPDPAHISKSSFGMELIRDLVKQLKGILSIDSQAGAKFSIDFPLIEEESNVEG